MSLDFQFFPGRVDIGNVIISNGNDKADITELFKELNINTNVNSLSAVAEFVILDANNFLHSWRPNAGDDISIEISYSDETKIFGFKILSINNLSNFDSQRAYTFNCVSHFYYKAMHFGVRGAYTGTTSNIAKGLFLENLDNDKESFNVWEESSGSQKIVVPEWSLAYTMEWLARRSKWTDDIVRMKFFQDSNMKYNFMPIESALKRFKEPAFKYTYNLVAATLGKEQKPNSADTIRAVKDLTMDGSLFNIKRAYDSGKISGTRYAPDIVNKSYDPVGFNYFELFSKESYLNSLPNFNSYNYEGISQYDVNASLTQPDVSEFNKVSDASNIRKSSIDMSQSISIEVVGNQLVDIGQVIELEVSSPEPVSDSRDDVIDKRFSGLYYVVSKRDVYNEDVHKMALGLVKESQIGA